MENRIIIEGKGIPIVLVHGMGGPKIWMSAVAKLRERFQVIVPTFPGFLSDDVDFIYSDELYVNFLIDLRTYLKIEKWNIVGMSMGGRTSINYSMKEKNHISSLTVIDSIGIGYMSPALRSPLLRKVFPFMLRSILANESVRNKLGIRDFVNKDVFNKCKSWGNELWGNKIIRHNLSMILTSIAVPQEKWKDELPRLDIPTQILWASEDDTAPIQWGKWLKSMIPDSELHVLDGYKHMAILEKSDFFADLISNFVTKNNFAS